MVIHEELEIMIQKWLPGAKRVTQCPWCSLVQRDDGFAQVNSTNATRINLISMA